MTIVQRGNRFGVKVWERGSKKYRWLGTYATRLEAERAESDASLKDRKDSPTVAQWSRVWLSDYARPAAATRMVYRQAANRITRELGALKLDDVTRPLAREKALAWPRNISGVARTMWADAVRNGIAGENPWTNMRIPQSRGRRDLVPLTEPELHELASVAGEMGPLVLTLGYTGLRPGELCGLRWEDVDLRGQEMTAPGHHPPASG
jgi:integrase